MSTRNERGRTAGVLVSMLALVVLLAWLAVNGTAFLPVSHRPDPHPGVTTTPTKDKP